MHATLAAEFPNDNPELHLGTIWVCRETCGAAEPEMPDEARMPTPTPTPTPTPNLTPSPNLLSASRPEFGVPPIPEIPPPTESMVVLAAPSRGELEAELVVDEIVIEELDFDLSYVPLESTPPPQPEPTETGALDDDAYATLVKTLSEVVEAEGGNRESVVALLQGEDAGVAAAWRAVLCGENDDISTCGAAMLDEWSADIVARALGMPAKATQLRRELRSRGVCAFGLVEAA